MSDPKDEANASTKDDNQNPSEPDDSLLFKALEQFTAKNSSVVVATSQTNPPTIRDFSIAKPISKGAFGKVFLGYKKTKPSQLYAIKVMKKSEMINKNMVSQVVTERNALALSQSPFCVRLFYSLQSPSSIYLVMEYMVGGDLKSLLAMYGFFDEGTSRFYAAEIILALQYLHKHGIVHRDIKPDNMLVSAEGHIKLTDFGLSKIELSRDLELSDLVNCSPNLNTRTPGQLLSLTSHLSFGSNEKRPAQIERKQWQVAEASMEQKHWETAKDGSISDDKDDSKISGVSPFFSAEDIILSSSMTSKFSNINESSGGSFKTAEGSTASSNIYITTSSNGIRLHLDTDSDKENSSKSFSFSSNHLPVRSVAFKFHEDSGISSRKGDYSAFSVINANNDYSSGSDLSRSNISDKSKHELHSPVRPMARSFKRPDFQRGMTRKRTLTNQADFSIDGEGGQHTGLTQEIELVMDIGSSTPKKHKAKDTSMEKGKSSPDDNIRISALNPNVIVSTPVSTQKITRGKKHNMLRFAVPHSSLEQQKKLMQYVKMTEDPAMSPIQNTRSVDEITPKMAKTPFRTPKSVRRGIIESSERILGTPDYLAPELLLMQGHGKEVDWWALGVCLYEFLTGIPPFNDDTPQKVFENILSRSIEWPVDEEALSDEAMEVVEAMLTMQPLARPGADECKVMKFFDTIDFDNIQNAQPPFVPNLDDPLDTGYFQARNEMQHLKLSNFEMS